MDNRKVIYLDDAIDALTDYFSFINPIAFVDILSALPPAEPETSRIENALHGKSAEEQYDFIWWLLQSYAMNFTDLRRAAIEWLKGEEE